MWPWPGTLALPMCLGSRRIPLTRICWRKVTERFFLITVVGVTETIVTPIEGLGAVGLDAAGLGGGGAAGLCAADGVDLGGGGAAWPVTGKRMVAARMVDAATEATRGFMMNSLLRPTRGKGRRSLLADRGQGMTISACGNKGSTRQRLALDRATLGWLR